jgi:hypothetical protein
VKSKRSTEREHKAKREVLFLDPALQAKAGHWNPAKQRSLADKLEGWARQLRSAADLIDGKAIIRAVN